MIVIKRCQEKLNKKSFNLDRLVKFRWFNLDWMTLWADYDSDIAELIEYFKKHEIHSNFKDSFYDLRDDLLDHMASQKYIDLLEYAFRKFLLKEGKNP